MQTDRQAIEELINQKLEAGKKKFGMEFQVALLEILGLQKLLAPEEKNRSRLIPLTRWNDYYPDPSVKALRMLVFRQHENGFDKVITRRGNRILIPEDAYFEWAKEHGRRK